MSQPHPHDSLLVTNIDTNCHDTEEFAIDQSVLVEAVPGEVNPMGIPQHRTERILGSFDHSKFFQVRYNGQPFRIAPGETRAWPRYIAEHYAKHLADHILTKMEDKEHDKAAQENRTPKVGFVQSATLRPEVLSKILKVEHLLSDDGFTDSQALTPDLPGVPTSDLGVVPNYAVGQLREQPKTAEEILGEGGGDLNVKDLSELEAKPELKITDSMTKADLVKEAVALGLDISGRESMDQLKSKIRAFVV